MIAYHVEERTEWRWWVTPKPLEDKPIHRWYTFPHSFTSELVHALVDEWSLGPEDHILDPFVGAGTTLLAAKEKGIPATGYDLSPFAVLVAKTKIANYRLPRLVEVWGVLKERLSRPQSAQVSRIYPELVQKALPGRLLAGFDMLHRYIENLSCSETERCFFRTALLAILPKYSHAVATGGWLKWVNRQTDATTIPTAFNERVETMLRDLGEAKLLRRSLWHVKGADARRLPDRDSTYSAVITSPPYPNRHDYTRVFGIELMLALLNWDETRKLRYQSFQSHPESRPERPVMDGYVPPERLTKTVEKLSLNGNDPRIPRMIEGYFFDMYICLREITRISKAGARVAFVVGNTQYYGEPVMVDELTAEIGEQAGLTCEKLVAVRYRGNSAQQMGKYGRKPSRESVVIFRRP
ncbi:MAG: DNA methyltransferase [Bacillota bacterium]